MPEGWPLTGRVKELSRISGLTRRRDGPAGVVLAGPAGVGKTRLAREALAAAETRTETHAQDSRHHPIMVAGVCAGKWRRMRDLNPRGF
ncbi:MAG: AAA family ATPase [Pseudonocardiaceae bacterium]